MTIDGPVQTSQFLVKKPPTFYKAKIPFKHWQLRSLLCSPSPELLYYPSNNRIYSLNTVTRKRRVVATLPFSPRCIGARYGWVCAGGADHGHFAAIRVNNSTDAANTGSTANADSAAAAGDSAAGTRSSESSPTVNINELGGTIVNSVTLHRPPSSTSDDDVLAVLTNNDKTVRIFHLAQNRVITTLHVDVSTNHASISPDGQHLVVVGDAPEVYFYHPATYNGSPGIGIGEAGCGLWILSSHPPLTAGTEIDALMSTSFSSSSLHCAVASQAGIITIFDTRYLSCDHPDGRSPLVKVITSSRAFTEPGAVRSVQFSPAPWDLLVWAEHCGRVCVADARNGFAYRQVIDVLVEKDNLIEAEIEEAQNLPSAWDISQTTSRRYPRDEEEGEDTTTSDTERSSITELADLVLETSSEWLASYNSRARTMAPGTFYPSGSELIITTPSRSWVASSGGSTPTLLRDYRERQIERERARQRIHDAPRRRNSIHPSYTDHSTSTSTSTNSAPAAAAASGTTSSNSRPTSDTESPGAERNRLLRSSAVLRPLEQLTNLIAVQRRRNARINRQNETNSPYPYAMTGDGVDITGCTLTPDGKKLFVATDHGVVEYEINILGRKVFPSVVPR